MTQTIIALSDITADAAIQQRLTINQALVDEYTETIADWLHTAPITVYRDDEGTHWLADGFHRHAAATQAELTEVHVEVRAGTKRDAMMHSLSANATHGYRRNAGDLKRAYETAVAQGFCSASDAAAVAQLLNCSERQARDLTADARNKAKDQQRAAILEQIDKGLSQREVAKAFGISAAMVNNIVHKRRSAESEHLQPQSIRPAPTDKASTDNPSRDHLTTWQKDLLARLDAQAKLNGRAGVAAAVEAWMSEGGAA